MADNNLIVGAVTDVGTTQYNQLGQLYVEPSGYGTDREPGTAGTQNQDYGERVWIYVYNDSGSAFAAGNLAIRKSATNTYRVRLSLTTSAPGLIVGVAQHAIANGEYGWILRRGIGEVLTDAAGSTADVGLMPSNATAGTAEAAAASQTAPTFGVASETVAGGLATCWINCLG